VTIDDAQVQDRVPSPFTTWQGVRCRVKRMNAGNSEIEQHSICTILHQRVVGKTLTDRAWLRRISHEFSVSFFELAKRWEWWNGVAWQAFELSRLQSPHSWRRYKPDWYKAAVSAQKSA